MKRFNITVNGTAYDVQVEEISSSAPAAASAPIAPAAPVAAPSAPAPVAAPAPAAPVAPSAAPAGALKITAPMPGSIIDVKVALGQQVAVNEVLLVLEAMKMENDIVAPSAGTIAGIHVNKGDSVDTGTLLISIS